MGESILGVAVGTGAGHPLLNKDPAHRFVGSKQGRLHIGNQRHSLLPTLHKDHWQYNIRSLFLWKAHIERQVLFG